MANYDHAKKTDYEKYYEASLRDRVPVLKDPRDFGHLLNGRKNVNLYLETFDTQNRQDGFMSLTTPYIPRDRQKIIFQSDKAPRDIKFGVHWEPSAVDRDMVLYKRSTFAIKHSDPPKAIFKGEEVYMRCSALVDCTINCYPGDFAVESDPIVPNVAESQAKWQLANGVAEPHIPGIQLGETDYDVNTAKTVETLYENDLDTLRERFLSPDNLMPGGHVNLSVPLENGKTTGDAAERHMPTTSGISRVVALANTVTGLKLVKELGDQAPKNIKQLVYVSDAAQQQNPKDLSNGVLGFVPKTDHNALTTEFSLLVTANDEAQKAASAEAALKNNKKKRKRTLIPPTDSDTESEDEEDDVEYNRPRDRMEPRKEKKWKVKAEPPHIFMETFLDDPSIYGDGETSYVPPPKGSISAYPHPRVYAAEHINATTIGDKRYLDVAHLTQIDLTQAVLIHKLEVEKAVVGSVTKNGYVHFKTYANPPVVKDSFKFVRDVENMHIEGYKCIYSAAINPLPHIVGSQQTILVPIPAPDGAKDVIKKGDNYFELQLRDHPVAISFPDPLLSLFAQQIIEQELQVNHQASHLFHSVWEADIITAMFHRHAWKCKVQPSVKTIRVRDCLLAYNVFVCDMTVVNDPPVAVVVDQSGTSATLRKTVTVRYPSAVIETHIVDVDVPLKKWEKATGAKFATGKGGVSTFVLHVEGLNMTARHQMYESYKTKTFTVGTKNGQDIESEYAKDESGLYSLSDILQQTDPITHLNTLNMVNAQLQAQFELHPPHL